MLTETFIGTLVAMGVWVIIAILGGVFRPQPPGWKAKISIVLGMYLGCGLAVFVMHWRNF